MMSTYNYLYALSYVVFKVQLHFFRHLSMPSGDEGIRTPDPLLARQVLSQLSYTPIPAEDLFPRLFPRLEFTIFTSQLRLHPLN